MDSLQSYINNVIGKIYPTYKSMNQIKLDETGDLSDEMEQIQSNLNFIFTSQIKIVVVYFKLKHSQELKSTRYVLNIKLKVYWKVPKIVIMHYMMNQVFTRNIN